MVTGMICILGICTYAWLVSPLLEGPAAQEAVSKAPPSAANSTMPRLASDRQRTSTHDGPVRAEAREVARADGAPPEALRSVPGTDKAAALIDDGMRLYAQGQLIEARNKLNTALSAHLPPDVAARVRRALMDIADKTVLTPAIVEGDPFAGEHIVQPGETLGKIAKRYNVTADLLARINRIRDKNFIRLGQRLKVLHGPCHAHIHKDEYALDLYLQDTFIKRYPVGLGTDDSTPTGQWKIGTKLTNPTYFPPRGGQIVAADDSENPLGEYWLALVGIGGNAVGRARYGIHGTIEPESIGKSASMGCVRLHNDDIAELYAFLISEKSHVTIE